RSIGSDFASELAFDLANGFLPKRFAACRKVVKSNGRGALWILLAASVSWITSLALLLMTAGALYYALTRAGGSFVSLGFPDLTVLRKSAVVGATVASVAALGIIALKERPQLLWGALLGGTACAAALFACCSWAWTAAWPDLGTLL